ncbi:hypothetical protein TMatcc_009633 [Talaromyces marneffei ATCC 18224]|uniref:WD repeat protein n=1 Tax=Talaromyces marneffei (strain ATCC 18224 / CBS 334.59 / QM 7333) TaxID=441960 RepID=B6QSW1_TALMQ|nr:WD repeat protein [Talaromyces marneffei ATCC 18224]
MADQGSPPGNRSGSDDLSDQFHPAYEFLNNADEDDDDDMDFDPETGASNPLIYFDVDAGDADDDDVDYEVEEDEGPYVIGGGADDDERILTMGAILAQQTAAEDEEEEDPQPSQTRARLFQLLGPAGLQALLQSHGLITGSTHFVSGALDDDDGFSYGSSRFNRRRRAERHPPPKVPSENGIALMNSGFYGNNTSYVDEAKRRKKKLATRIMWRELGIGAPGERSRDTRLVFQDLIPSSKPEKILRFDEPCYSGQFSDDGNFFFSCNQDFKVRMYDTSNPHDWRYYKTVPFMGGQWTITDATLSPDNKWLAVSSIQRQVTLASTDPNDTSDPLILDFAPNRRHYNGRFGIWSLRFSGDGREIVAGTANSSVIVYDIETQRPILELEKHQDDVNAVCFGDSSSPHILYSGSDDTTIRVWDRRSMNDSREAGAFVGHTEGLTYVDSKGDGRYVLSNGKDQTMKLWDLRKMITTEKFDKINIDKYTTGFDYRYTPVSMDYKPHPHDCSVVTYRGHKVLRTLIRCHFSPPSSTNSRYVYTGSYDGKVYVYNIDATLAGVIDVDSAVSAGRDPHEMDEFSQYSMGIFDNHGTIVRDVSWHPSVPILAASCWNSNGESRGSCSIHSWNDSNSEDEGDPVMGTEYDEKLRPWRVRRSSRRYQRFRM